MILEDSVGPARLLGEALAEASPDLMRSLLQTMINARSEVGGGGPVARGADDRLSNSDITLAA